MNYFRRTFLYQFDNPSVFVCKFIDDRAWSVDKLSSHVNRRKTGERLKLFNPPTWTKKKKIWWKIILVWAVLLKVQATQELLRWQLLLSYTAFRFPQAHFSLFTAVCWPRREPHTQRCASGLILQTILEPLTQAVKFHPYLPLSSNGISTRMQLPLQSTQEINHFP